MKVSPINNTSFGTIRITDYDGLDSAAKAFVREIDETYKPTGIVCKTMTFTRPEYERFVRKLLNLLGIEHTKIDDKTIFELG